MTLYILFAIAFVAIAYLGRKGNLRALAQLEETVQREFQVSLKRNNNLIRSATIYFSPVVNGTQFQVSYLAYDVRIRSYIPSPMKIMCSFETAYQFVAKNASDGPTLEVRKLLVPLLAFGNQGKFISSRDGFTFSVSTEGEDIHEPGRLKNLLSILAELKLTLELKK